ncbi:uncharacterized protein LOC134219578 [Armigeres subalbatus]|uniref:uncharacterized protein LOC134219578 n=1 Tax=Armigeres subalbatus TaxID=124917 RepID=UPI002ED493D3
MNSLQLRSNADRFSMKVRRLSPEDMERYREKIVKVGGVDPYTMDFQEDVLPLTVDYDRIFCYLITNLSFRSGLPNRNNKSLEAFKAFQSGFVKAVNGCQYEDVYVVQGKVLHSMNLSDPPAECWVIINNSCDVDDVEDVGSIESAHCDCTAGAGETCSHVAATLYALSYAREICLGRRLSVTELPAYWMQPGGSGADENLYATVDSICFGRKRETECALRDVNLDKTDKDYQELIQSIISSGHTVAASRAFFRELNDDEDTELILRRSQLEKLSFKHFFDEQNTTKTLNELIGMVDQVNWQISEDDQNLIEQHTRDQAANILWFQLRYGRITASILLRQESKLHQNLCFLLFLEKMSFKISQLLYMANGVSIKAWPKLLNIFDLKTIVT